jgi:hypothetical protein
MSPTRKKIDLIHIVFNIHFQKLQNILVCTGMLFSTSIFSQSRDTMIKGVISFVSPKNTYVKFDNTNAIKNGDTLYISTEPGLKPVFVVINKSSTSCVCTPLTELKLTQSTELLFKYSYVPVSEASRQVSKPPKEIVKNPEQDTSKKIQKTSSVKDNDWKGRLTLSSYSGFSDIIKTPSHRLTYTLSLGGDRIGKTGLSIESYISFRHKIGEWYKVKENINDALKIYALAARYQFKNNLEVSLGRRINYRLSSMGAIDGIQVEKGFQHFIIGVVAGSRPDYYDYGVNLKYFETGAFIGHNLNIGNKLNIENTLAIVNQLNHGKTDRRFLHFQHSSTLFNNLSLFSSMEFDMYQKINDVESNTLRLSNIYLTLRYRFSRKLSFSASYDARSFIIYYETDKNAIDRLLEEATRQGLRLQINYQPFRMLSLGVSGNLRFQKDHLNESKNLNGYLTYSNIPLLNCSVNITSNYLQTQYLESKVIGLTLSRDIISSRVYGDVYYRLADYNYFNSEYGSTQRMIGLNLSYRVNNTLSFNAYGEETFEQNSRYLIVNLRAMLRF